MLKSYPQFAQKLHDHLEDRDFTRAWLERKVGVSVGSISRWISYEKRPGDPEVIYNIADILGLSDRECQELIEDAGHSYSKRENRSDVEDQHLDEQGEAVHLVSNTSETKLYLKEIKDKVSLVAEQNEQIDNKITTVAQNAEAQSKLLANSLSAHDGQRNYQPPQQDLQLPIVRPFVGREEIVRQVIEQLQPGNAVTLWGAGGQGKTSISWKALSVLRASGELTKRFPDGTILHNFAAQPALEAALTHITKSLNEESDDSPIGACLRALSGKQALLIFESTEEADEETLRTLYALGNECGLLITTRRQTDAPDKDYLHQIVQLPLKDATTLLGGIVNTQGKVPSNAARLCNLIDSQPLAVRVAASYLVESGETIDEYIEWLEEDSVGALTSSSLMERMLQHTVDQIPEDARLLLALSACLGLALFQENVITSVLPWNRTQYKRSRKQLLDYGLLRQIGSKQLQITHTLIYHYARGLQEYQQNYLDALSNYFVQMVEKNSEGGQVTLKDSDNNSVHILAVLKKCEELQKWNTANKLFLTTAVGKDSYFGKYAFSQQHITAFEIGLAAARSLGEAHDEGIRMGQLGRLYLYHGIKEGITYLEQALTFAQKAQNQDEELDILLQLGSAYTAFNKGEAINKYKQVLSITQEREDRTMEIDCLIKLSGTYVQAGQAGMAAKQYENAIAIAQEIEDYEKESSLLSSLAILYARLDHEEEAIKIFEQRLKSFKTSGDMQKTLSTLGAMATSYAIWNRFEKAIDTYKQAYTIAESIDDKPKMSSYLMSIGDLYANNKQTKRAMENYEQANSIAEITQLSILLQLSDFYYNHGEISKAEHYREKAYQDVMQSKREQEQLWQHEDKEQPIAKVGKAPPKSEIIFELGGVNSWGEKIYLLIKLPYKLYHSLEIMTARGFVFDPRHYGEIVAAGRGESDTRIMAAMRLVYNVANGEIADMQVLNLNPKSGEDFRHRAYIYLLEKDYDAAQSDLIYAIQLEPDNASGYANYGRLLRDLEQYQKSCEYYERAIMLNSEEASYYSGRGMSWFELRQFSNAKTDFQCAITLKPREPWYHYWLGRTLTEMRDLKSAQQELYHAFQFLPWENSFFRLQSSIYEEQMEYAAAWASLERAVELAPENALNYDAVAHLELVQSNYESALHPIQKAIELNPESDNCYYWRGLAYLGKGQLESAIQNIERSIGNSTNDLKVVYTKFWLGVVDTLQSKPQQAKKEWDEVRATMLDMHDEIQKLRVMALLELFRHKSKAYELFESILNAKQGTLATPLMYLRLLAHLFSDRSDIQEITCWFEEQIIERFCQSTHESFTPPLSPIVVPDLST
jgi:tetratricopeptide (TPR) repeat protein